MPNLVGRLAAAVVSAVAAAAAVTIVTPAVSSAQCDAGQYWDPFSKTCRPLGVGPPAG